MRRTARMMTALITLLLFSGIAQAEHTGPYLGAHGGWSMLFDGKSSDDQGTFNMTYRSAPQWGLALGWDISPDNPLGGEGRIELEYTRRSNRLDKVGFAEGAFQADGELTVDSLLVSTHYVHRTASSYSPYFSLGAGAARMAASGFQVTGQPLGSDTVMVFAYQVGGGIDYLLVKNVSLDAGYRFFGTSLPKFTEPDGRSFTTGYLGHTVILGIRYGF